MKLFSRMHHESEEAGRKVNLKKMSKEKKLYLQVWLLGGQVFLQKIEFSLPFVDVEIGEFLHVLLSLKGPQLFPVLAGDVAQVQLGNLAFPVLHFFRQLFQNVVEFLVCVVNFYLVRLESGK